MRCSIIGLRTQLTSRRHLSLVSWRPLLRLSHALPPASLWTLRSRVDYYCHLLRTLCGPSRLSCGHWVFSCVAPALCDLGYLFNEIQLATLLRIKGFVGTASSSSTSQSKYRRIQCRSLIFLRFGAHTRHGVATLLCAMRVGSVPWFPRGFFSSS